MSGRKRGLLDIGGITIIPNPLEVVNNLGNIMPTNAYIGLLQQVLSTGSWKAVDEELQSKTDELRRY